MTETKTVEVTQAERDEAERDIRVAIWNAGMNGGMGQDLSQAFIRRAMDEPTMQRALARLASQSLSTDEEVADAVHEELWKADAEVRRLRAIADEAIDLADGLCASHDYLGTGSDSRGAAQEQAEDEATIARLRAALQSKDTPSHGRG